MLLIINSPDFKATWIQFENHPVNLRWQEAMASFFEPHECLRLGERFPMMQEVFYLL